MSEAEGDEMFHSAAGWNGGDPQCYSLSKALDPNKAVDDRDSK